jgi:ABC-type siderophore export system fused ATPase/permease subunit
MILPLSCVRNLLATWVAGIFKIVFDIFKPITHEFWQTIIAVTHDNDFAGASDRTIELADGKIINHDKDFNDEAQP